MRSAAELVDLPYSFTQLGPLMPDAFARSARERGVSLTVSDLETLHRLGLLVPFLRVRRDGRAIARYARSEPILAGQLAHWQPTQRRDLEEARRAGRLFAAGDEPFLGRQRRKRGAGDLTYLSSDYLYSPHQVLGLAKVRHALPHVKHRQRSSRPSFDGNPHWLRFARRRDRELREVIVTVSALEPIYYPQIVERLTMSARNDFAAYDEWGRERRGAETLAWLGIEPDWLTDVAEGLLREADNIDPLGDWVKVVREADPGRWPALKDQARSAMDFRIAAEVLLRCHDELASTGNVDPIEPPAPRTRGPFDSRLKRQGGLDATLTDFGLSPHPRLLLVVEGDTELLLFPRLMALFGIRRDDDFIAIQNAEGIDKDINALVSFAVAPRAEPDPHGRYLELQRPLTRILVVTDAEGRMETIEQRHARKQVWVERLMRALPRSARSSAVRDSMQRLVYVDTWNRRGGSFEFAHFTDRQLAMTIASIDRRARQPSLPERVRHIGTIRAQRGNLKTALGPSSKLDLADALWPTLEQKIRRAQARGTERRIPIVRVMDRATDLARELPRRNVVIPITRERTS